MTAKALVLPPPPQIIKTPKDVKIPAIFKKSVEMIEKSISIEESKQWVDKSEALAVWAKMYQDDEVGRAAKRLRLHAHKRMGALALELQPTKPIKGGGRTPGPVALLRENGLSRHKANAALVLAGMNKSDFKHLIDEYDPPAPTTVERRKQNRSELGALRNNQRNPFCCRIFTSENNPADIAEKLSLDEKKSAADQIAALAVWCEEFIAACNK